MQRRPREQCTASTPRGLLRVHSSAARFCMPIAHAKSASEIFAPPDSRRKSRDHFRDLARAPGADAKAAETFADCFAVLIEGALVLRQTQGRNDAARVVRPAVEQLIATYLTSDLGSA